MQCSIEFFHFVGQTRREQVWNKYEKLHQNRKRQRKQAKYRNQILSSLT